MNLNEIEQSVAELDLTQRFDLIYDLLAAYGIPQASITRLRKGSYDQSDSASEHLWKGKLFYRFVEDDEGDLHALIDTAQANDVIARQSPRFLIVRNATRLLAIDTRTHTTLDIPLSELSGNTSFFLPWAGIEKAALENLNFADVKAAEKMARLYDEVIQHNTIETEQDIRNLNVFFSRLLFCFFAEDTRVFPASSFTNAIASLTQADGNDTAAFLEDLFVVLNTAADDRVTTPAHFSEFGYVNGSLFADPLPAPSFSSKARRIMLDCGTLDWSEINPDIFGSMIQAVVHPSQREGLGMHYTSVENIMRVIRPLFLDELHASLDAADTVPKLRRLLDRVAALKVFDPACGSGNFLVIAYKELRKVEHRIIQRINSLEPFTRGMFELSRIKLDHFYGIEIDDFAHEMATLSLWLAKHQMNIEFEELFGIEISLIPLRDTGNIVCGNAARIEWESVCPQSESCPVFVLGNPPYLGGSNQRAEHKADFAAYFGTTKYPRDLDYISLWFLKGSEYILDGRASLGFVSTNSICQGAHVGLLWPKLLALGVQVSFARTSFPWSNNAKGNAGVVCVIVGLSAPSSAAKRLFDDASERRVEHINPYLAASTNDTIVHKSRTAISDRPVMFKGSSPVDDGHLSLTGSERDELLLGFPAAEQFIKPYVGSREFIHSIERYCLWISDDAVSEAEASPAIAGKLREVRAFRSRSSKKATQKYAELPHRFMERRHQDQPSVVVPRLSSVRRDYIPMGFHSAGTVASDQLYVAYGAEPWLFALLQSRMHMAWAETIGGRMKVDYRY